MVNRGAPRRNLRQKGSELIEFTLCFLPLLIMVFVLLDAAWAIFSKATLSFAVRMALRTGITITGTQATAANSDLVAMTKANVQKYSLGLLRGTTGWNKIKVHFWQPPAPGTNAAPTLVDAQADANKPYNIMQVSVEGFTLSPLVPRLFSWKDRDTSATPIAATCYDLIEPSRDVPPKGSAP